MAQQLNNLTNALQGRSEQATRKLLEAEGRRLKYIALKLWRKYLASYQPKQYARTRKSQRGIKLGRVKWVDGNHLGIELTFENDLMYHDSVVKGSKKKGHSVMLISEGWNQSKRQTKLSRMLGGQVYRFTYFEGTNYLAEVEKAYNTGKPVGVRLETQWSGKFYK